jgi:hypothetical protein
MAPKVVLGIPDPPRATPALDDRDLCYSYAIARGETGVLTFEPYKSLILPFWAFRTASIARTSAEVLWAILVSSCERGDFVVNSDPKIHINNIAERANGWKGSRHDPEVHPNGSNEIETACESQRYVLGLLLRMSRSVHRSSQEGAKYGPDGKVLEQWSGMDVDGKKCEKDKASEVFKEYWRRCTSHTTYLSLKEQWKKTKMEYQKTGSTVEEATPRPWDGVSIPLKSHVTTKLGSNLTLCPQPEDTSKDFSGVGGAWIASAKEIHSSIPFTKGSCVAGT